MKHIVTVGGGTGTFVVLSALKRIPDIALSAIVTEADDGGSTGRLRDAYGFLPPGDARQALVALAEDGNVLRDLFAYRFMKSEVAGHNLGNLFITALSDILGSDVAAFEEASRILRVRGKVIPATETPATLRAEYEDGSVIEGEKYISEPDTSRSRIKELSLASSLPLTASVKDSIARADIVVLGPGSLYASTIAALLPDGMQEALRSAKSHFVYVVNLFSKAGQTDGYTVMDHVHEVERYAGRRMDTIFINKSELPPEVLMLYEREGEFPVKDDTPNESRIHRLPLAAVEIIASVANDPLRRSFIRHDSRMLAEAFSKFIA